MGQIDDAWLAVSDRQGVSVGEAIRSFGLDPARMPEAILGEDAFAYMELHIEQGPVLESEGTPLGVVRAIAGQSRLELTLSRAGESCGYDADAAPA